MCPIRNLFVVVCAVIKPVSEVRILYWLNCGKTCLGRFNHKGNIGQIIQMKGDQIPPPWKLLSCIAWYCQTQKLNAVCIPIFSKNCSKFFVTNCPVANIIANSILFCQGHHLRLSFQQHKGHQIWNPQMACYASCMSHRLYDFRQLVIR